VNRRRPHILATSLAVTLFVNARAAAQDARVRDSSGVQIIENSALKDAPIRFKLGDIPFLEVGGIEANPDEEFDHKQGWLAGARLSSGGLAVIDLTRVHYFDSKGKRIRIVGRRGQGPDEFQTLTTICRTRGDTLVVNDMSNRRVSILAENGSIVRTILQGDNGAPSGSACFEDGSFIVQRSVGMARNRQAHVTRLRTDGSVANVVGTFDMTGFDLVTQTPLRILASRNAIYLANPYTSEVRIHDALGRLRRIIRTADHGDRITEALAEARLDAAFPGQGRMRAAPRIAQAWPVFYTLEVGSDGTIWVQDFDPRTFAPPDAWTAIDSTGRILGRLIFPPRPGGRTPHVQGFGRDYVIVKRFDEDRAQGIAVFPLLRIDGRSR
jgi:hypothetical protein